ncbi:MAG: GNAT family N-acetyltransferase [Ramlibacter sp.]
MMQPQQGGYLSARFAQSFSEFGNLHHLDNSNGWILERSVPGSGGRDATGLYPLFCCSDWDALQEDLDSLPRGLASITVVPDPFGHYTPELLAKCFQVVRQYRKRYIVRLDREPARFVTAHHRKYADKGFALLEVQRCIEPAAYLDEWVGLYANVCRKYAVTDLRALSALGFANQLAVPGLTMFRASYRGTPVAIHLWMHMGDVVYGHLAGHHPQAYRTHAAYSLYWTALQWFHTRADRIDLGSGQSDDDSDGLSFFKRGWSTETLQGWLCGRVLDPVLYDALLPMPKQSDANFFPAYRAERSLVGYPQQSEAK